MRAMSLYKAALLGASVCLLVVTQAWAEPQLDYARTLRQSGMVFIPYVGMQRGPLYYTEYEQVPTATARVFDLRRIIVNLIPTAHRRNLYNGFLRANRIFDAAVNPVPEVGECRPTEEILRLLANMPENYRPRILPGNYPIICSLSLYFLPEDESAIRNVIASRPVLTLRATIPLCAPDSPQVNVPAITQILLAEGVLRGGGAGGMQGNYWELLYRSVLLSQEQPGLFASTPPREGWSTLMKTLRVEPDSGLAQLPEEVAAQPLYLCAPDPLEIGFGHQARP